MPPLCSEIDLRKPSWNEATGRWVLFADGQMWLVPKPWFKRRPTLIEGVWVEVSKTDFGAEFDQLVADANTTNASFLTTCFLLAKYMLKRSYDLTDDQVADLCEWDSRSDTENGWQKDVYQVANGFDAPKPSSDGEE